MGWRGAGRWRRGSGEQKTMSILLPKNGEGFALRSVTRGDAERLAEIEFDAEVKQYLALPKLEKSQWIEKFDPDLYVAYAIEVDGVLAGRGSIRPYKRKGNFELAIVIERSFWGLMLGRKVAAMLIQAAFEELNAKAVVALVHPENRASIALLRAFKFRRRGIVEVPANDDQQGHFIYRMSRESYNQRIGSESPQAAGA